MLCVICRVPQVPSNPAVFPAGSDEGKPFPAKSDALWYHTWTWRRAYCAGNTSLFAVNVGDVTQQNLVRCCNAAVMFETLEWVS